MLPADISYLHEGLHALSARAGGEGGKIIGESFSGAQEGHADARLGLEVGVSRRSHLWEKHKHTAGLGYTVEGCFKPPHGCWVTRRGKLSRPPPCLGRHSHLVGKSPGTWV